jgi:tRNA A-37 threonylcarbamoyl transferase component Bud32/tetratricopeptide (TPR) repeat protein
VSARIDEVFHAVADLSAEKRECYFAEFGIETSVRREVEQLVAFDSCSTGALHDEIAQIADWTLSESEACSKETRCGQYRLTGMLGRGGMGAVYAAERVDGEIAQKVAVKLLRPGCDHHALQRRFLAERQILANLSHPNIAKLLDAGHRDDGQPYLVMEHVEGQPIDAHTAGKSIREKIALFIRVCGAVSYLHRNLVVHRDLKPSNILVGKDGEPKLLDFGIARTLDLTQDLTVTSMRMLTPEYASPEEVEGKPVTTAADIYSLGVVLYELLTGTTPYGIDGGSAGALALAISSGKITAPSKRVLALRGDLETILMKALRTEPQQRYASVDAFADDLDAYLESRPVRAHAGNSWYRARKFLRRHWVSALAATLAIGGLCGGVLVANHQRVIAERRFAQVRQLANKLFEIDAEVRQTPGTTKARQLIISTSLEYLGSLAAEAHGDPALSLELGSGYMNIARLQGVPILANLGQTDEAIKSSKMAELLIASVLSAQPGNRLAMLRMAQIAHDRMNIALRSSDSAAALSFATQSARWLRKYDSSGSGDRAQANTLSATYLNVCNAFAFARHPDEAIPLCNRGIEVAAMTGLPFRTGTALLSKANALRYAGRLEEALDAVREAMPLVENSPNPEGVRNRAIVGGLIREGGILGERDAVSLGNTEEAKPLLNRAFSMADDLTRRDLNDADSRDRLSVAGLILAKILRDQAPQRSLEICDRTLSRLGELSSANDATRLQQVQMLAESSYALRNLGRDTEAHKRLEQAVEGLRLLKFYPVKRLQQESNETLSALAEYDAADGNLQRAAETYENLLQLAIAGGEKPDAVLVDAADISRLYAKLAGLHRRMGHGDLAADYQARRLELWRHWDVRLPHNTYVHRQLVVARSPNNQP